MYADHWPRSIVLEVGPDKKDTPQGDRDFFCERLKSGELSAPRMPTKNRLYVNRATGRTIRRVVTDRHRHFRRLISHACAGLEVCCMPVRLAVHQTFGTKRTVAGVDYAGQDSDACLAAVRDAIQAPRKPERYLHPRFSGLILDDAQIVIDETSSQYLRGVYSLRIEITAMGSAG